ncbi:MAG: flagellar hook-length control protein FliK [Deltaproteobacteria bacterium]|nr:flagellar hook-length control protein FliK [Deltaproteobacteria bacterium]
MNLQKQMVGDGQDSTAKQGAKREAHDARSVVNAPVAEFGPKAERLPEISAREAAKPASIQAAPVAAAVQTAAAPKAAEAAASDRNGFSAIQAAAAKSVVRDNGAAGMFGQVEKKAVNAKDSGSLGRAAKANQAKMIEQIQKAFESALQSKDGNTLTIKIDPVELGAMTVKVTKRAEQIFARVTAESPEVQEVLRSNVQEVVQALAAAGFKLHNVHVTIGNEILETESFQYQGFSEQYVQDERSNHSGSHSAGHDGEHDLPSSASQDGDAADAQAGWVA